MVLSVRSKTIFALKIAQLRNGRSYRDFSKDIRDKTMVSISHSTLHDYEDPNGQMPRPKTLDVLAQYANVPPSWFFEESELNLIDKINTLDDLPNPGEYPGELIPKLAELIKQNLGSLTPAEKEYLFDMNKLTIESIVKRNKEKEK